MVTLSVGVPGTEDNRGDGDECRFALPMVQTSRPGIQAVLEIVSTPWNQD